LNIRGQETTATNNVTNKKAPLAFLSARGEGEGLGAGPREGGKGGGGRPKSNQIIQRLFLVNGVKTRSTRDRELSLLSSSKTKKGIDSKTESSCFPVTGGREILERGGHLRRESEWMQVIVGRGEQKKGPLGGGESTWGG